MTSKVAIYQEDHRPLHRMPMPQSCAPQLLLLNSSQCLAGELTSLVTTHKLAKKVETMTVRFTALELLPPRKGIFGCPSKVRSGILLESCIACITQPQHQYTYGFFSLPVVEYILYCSTCMHVAGRIIYIIIQWQWQPLQLMIGRITRPAMQPADQSGAMVTATLILMTTAWHSQGSFRCLPLLFGDALQPQPPFYQSHSHILIGGMH